MQGRKVSLTIIGSNKYRFFSDDTKWTDITEIT
jgi:hypothetical protein